MKFSIKDFFIKCDQIHRKLRIWSHLLKKSLMENFIFLCSVASFHDWGYENMCTSVFIGVPGRGDIWKLFYQRNKWLSWEKGLSGGIWGVGGYLISGDIWVWIFSSASKNGFWIVIRILNNISVRCLYFVTFLGKIEKSNTKWNYRTSLLFSEIFSCLT